jgi:hypothetical protein
MIRLFKNLYKYIAHQAITDVSGRSFSWSSKETMDIRNAFKAYFNGPAGAIQSQNQYLSLMLTSEPHGGIFLCIKCMIGFYNRS